MELGKIVIMMPELYQDYKVRGSEWIEIAEKVWQVQQARKEYERIEGKLLDMLKDLSEGLSSKGGNYVFTAGFRKGSVDYAAIPYLKSIDLENFRKPDVATWSLKQI